MTPPTSEIPLAAPAAPAAPALASSRARSHRDEGHERLQPLVDRSAYKAAVRSRLDKLNSLRDEIMLEKLMKAGLCREKERAKT